MNPHTHLQQRTGGRFGAKLPPPAPPTAAELLANPPPGIDGARVVIHEGQQEGVPNAAWGTLFAWFEAILDAGGSPADMEKAWELWDPPIWAGSHPRRMACDRFNELKTRAWARTHGKPVKPVTRSLSTLRYELALAQQALADVEPRYHLLKQARDLAKGKLDAAVAAAGETAS